MACQNAFRLMAIFAFTIMVISHAPAFAPDTNDPLPPGVPDNVTAAPEILSEDEDYYELYKTLVDTVDQVERNYVKKISRREIIEAAIEGIVTKLDPHSTYIGPDELKGFKSTVESQFGGIGIQIAIDRGQLKVSSPLVGTPAYRAGLRAGDRILKIEGESTSGFSLEDAVSRLKGEVGTSVNLTISHAGSNRPIDVTIEREVIQVETILGDARKSDDSWDFMIDNENRIGYIRLTAFSRDTARDLRNALQDLKKRNLNGLILDLRFNPGGLLTSAIEVSDLFLNEGKIVSTAGRNVPERVWNASKKNTFDGFPMVVLVNRYSASASEIVAAALQDHKRAVVVGERTWGKGSVQNVIEMENHRSALKLTTASYQRPSGKNIHRFPDAKESDDWGVRPDEGFELRLNERQMVDMVQVRKQRDVVTSQITEDSDTTDAQQTTEAATEEPAVQGPEPKPGTDPAASDAATSDSAASASSVTARNSDPQLQKALDHLLQQSTLSNTAAVHGGNDK